MYLIGKINKTFLGLKHLESFEDRKKGFIGWKKSPNDFFGLLFYNKEPRIQSYWMHTVPFDLEALGFDENNILKEIIFLKAFDRKSISFNNPIKNVIEVRKNWCKDNNVQIGNKIYLKYL